VASISTLELGLVSAQVPRLLPLLSPKPIESGKTKLRTCQE